jgi:hypothetical protein
MNGLLGFLLGFVIGTIIMTVIYYKMMKTVYKFVKAHEMTINTANQTINYVGNIAKKAHKWRKGVKAR